MEHKKSYTSDIEEQFRMKIFMENKHKIAQHNIKYGAGQVSYKLGLNKYSDMVSENNFKKFLTDVLFSLLVFCYYS